MSRGFIFADLASTSAALTATSPWLASRGGSASNCGTARSAGNTPSDFRLSSAASASGFDIGEDVHGGSFVCAGDSFPLSTAGQRGRGSSFGARLSQFRRAVKQSPVLGERIAIGLAGEEVAGEPRPPSRIELHERLRASHPATGGPVLGIVSAEEVADDPLGLLP